MHMHTQNLHYNDYVLCSPANCQNQLKAECVHIYTCYYAVHGNRAPTMVVYQELSHTSTGVLYYMVYKVYPSSKSASQAYKM